MCLRRPAEVGLTALPEGQEAMGCEVSTSQGLPYLLLLDELRPFSCMGLHERRHSLLQHMGNGAFASEQDCPGRQVCKSCKRQRETGGCILSAAQQLAIHRATHSCRLCLQVLISKDADVAGRVAENVRGLELEVSVLRELKHPNIVQYLVRCFMIGQCHQ